MHGIDISSHQTGIDLSKLDIDFVIMKATEGCSYVNPDCDRAYQQAIRLGLTRGVYHYASGNHNTGADEANYFLDHILNYIYDAILVLDWEGYAMTKGPSYALSFLNRVWECTGVKPMIYMNRSCIESYDWTPVVNGDYGLWLATLDGSVYHNYGEFPLVAMVQISETKRLSGYNGNLDFNIFHGDKDTWFKYQGKEHQFKEPIPKPEPTLKYREGMKVRFSTCYVSSTDRIESAIPARKMLRDTGTITRTIPGAKNPYLIDEGLCWVNDGDIREVLNA